MAAAIIAVLASRAGAGSLDPPGPVAGTMHTLGDTPPAWDQVLNAANGAPGPANPPAGCDSDRFKCVINYQQCAGFCVNVFPAVLDEETGLVWQRGPSSTLLTRDAAEAQCGQETTGNRGGWRLPTQAELNSLQTVNGSLPAGNPFSGVATNRYWTSTLAEDTALLDDGFSVGFPGHGFQSTMTQLGYWCVRGSTSNG